MLKKLHFKSLLLLAAMVFGVGNVWGAPVTVSMTSFTSTTGNVGGDENISYAAAQGTAGTAPAVNSNEIRVYQNGGTFTVTANNGVKINSVTIGSSMITTVTYSVDGGTASANQNIAANGTTTVEGLECTSVKFTCTGTDKSHRLYVNSLSVTYTPAVSYTVTAVSNNVEYGTVSCEGTTITATPNAGYRVVAGAGGYTVTNGTATVVNNGDNTFTVTPSTNCTVQINFEAIPTHTVTVTETGGTITVKDGENVIASDSRVREGTELTITAVAGVGKVFNSWNLTGATPASATAATTTFTMGSSDVTVAANYDDATTHAISWSVNGKIIRKDNVVEGEDIDFPTAITGIPNGYELTGWVLPANKIDTPTDTDPSANYVTAATSTADVTYYAVMAVVTGSTPESWTEEDLENLTSSDIFVFADDTYAMTNDNGTSDAPAVETITVSDGKITSVVADNLKWNVSGNNTDGYIFYPNGSTTTWLYCNTTANSSSNNNLRVGTGARKVWEVNGSGYLVTNDTYTARYLSRFQLQDFRGYTSTSNGAFVPTFYKYNAATTTYAGYCTTVAPEAVAIGAAGMATFCSANDLDFTDVAEIDVYMATVEGTTINFTRIKKVPANTGVLLRNSTGAKAAVAAVNVPVLSGNADDVAGNLFVAATVEIANLASSADGYKNYILNDGANGLGFYLANNHKVGAGKAYLHVPESAAKGFITFDDATGIELVNTASDMNSAVYNLQGQRVSEGYKGVVIVNGKKIIK